jgi:hypothetical protein
MDSGLDDRVVVLVSVPCCNGCDCGCDCGSGVGLEVRILGWGLFGAMEIQRAQSNNIPRIVGSSFPGRPTESTLHHSDIMRGATGQTGSGSRSGQCWHKNLQGAIQRAAHHDGAVSPIPSLRDASCTVHLYDVAWSQSHWSCYNQATIFRLSWALRGSGSVSSVTRTAWLERHHLWRSRSMAFLPPVHGKTTWDDHTPFRDRVNELSSLRDSYVASSLKAIGVTQSDSKCGRGICNRANLMLVLAAALRLATYKYLA